MLKATWKYHKLVFRKPAGTSRGVLLHKDSWFINVFDDENHETLGIGECGLIPGLSIDPLEIFEKELDTLCASINAYDDWIANSGHLFPSIKFALQTAILDLNSGGKRIFQQNYFTSGINGIPINGLIWMGSKEEMKQQVEDKVGQGFGCLKLKVGALGFNHEIEVLRYIRKEFKRENIELRLDANGAFEPEIALEKLKILSEFEIHSIEQPIKQGQVEQMAQLCSQSPIRIALDEELIGVVDFHQRKLLLETIKPSFIILKPSLLGGLNDADEWINLANQLGIGWWATSALESNIGLNAIAQWISQKDVTTLQGLGTGQLFTNNFQSPLTVSNGKLFHLPEIKWEINL
jgi:o-succinylbenzoate synthase